VFYLQLKIKTAVLPDSNRIGLANLVKGEPPCNESVDSSTTFLPLQGRLSGTCQRALSIYQPLPHGRQVIGHS